MSDKKTLLPELLPTPTAVSRATPAERVAERARVMLQRFRGVGAAASAALIGAHCTGYGVVDPLPPPPDQCSAAPPDAFTTLLASATYVRDPPSLLPPVSFELSSERYTGLGLVEARATGGTITSSTTFDNAYFGTRFALVIQPDTSTSTIELEADLSCGGDRQTRRFGILYHLPMATDLVLTVIER